MCSCPGAGSLRSSCFPSLPLAYTVLCLLPEIGTERACYRDMSSFPETKAEKYVNKIKGKKFLQYNRLQLSRIYPKGQRLDSSNYDPLPMWICGSQLVALNFQTPGESSGQGRGSSHAPCGKYRGEEGPAAPALCARSRWERTHRPTRKNDFHICFCWVSHCFCELKHLAGWFDKLKGEGGGEKGMTGGAQAPWAGCM